MAGFLNKIKSASSVSPILSTKDAQPKKKDESLFEVTPLERMLQHAGPLREDGSDRFFGFENALFYSDLFRDNVIKYPPHSPSDTPNGIRPKVNVTIRPLMNPTPPTLQQKQKTLPASQAMKQRQVISPGQPMSGQTGIKPEDKPDTPEYKKKQAMLKGPILELAQENAVAYGMDECTFTGLKDIFLALMDSKTRTGVLSPQRFLEIFKRDNEMFRNSMHQDAHEFYGLVLNDVIANVEAKARKTHEQEAANKPNGLAQSVGHALGSTVANNTNGYRSPGTGWVHDIFEGVLTSETKCLTCETASQRDETFLDLSIDLEEHSSVTSCLRKFSAEEMLCERNKFHCDHCGGLQEAEKRMKVKRLPKVLTLHLKRFKYTDDYSRLQKLFHRVVYPYHLRMFNTTEDAEDPDRLYELYAVVVHIGGNVYHGHYVSIIKTKDRGWVLFDDEMVEPVDKHFVRNFFGDKPGMATAYVLFYQETTFEKVREEQEREGMEEVKLATQAAHVAHEDGDKADTAPLKRQTTQPTPLTLERESMSRLSHARTAPDMPSPPPDAKTKEEKKREKKEREAAEKAAKHAEKERGRQAKEAEREKEKQAKEAEKERGKQAKEAERERERQAKEEDKRRKDEKLGGSQARRSEQDEPQSSHDEGKRTEAKEEEPKKKEPNGSGSMSSLLDRSKRGSKSMSKRSFSFFHKDKGISDTASGGHENGDAPEKQEKTKGRLSIGLGRKKSGNLLS
ncbi:ubiquitin carboxyl-terminal hydrolase domain-containing protein [Hirsutella rhossiliensis]|uniref:ubiquitinyl hydrolase 1 n=1 Tax=Hirsutella rhossiliensis TaxID=111463 RepID=A0A9P8MLL3_9HYPO|nr:ubiquitin carboxyl-terminal hydrolase domain-containing protein [Hirsutella rhossiliensis]KAH0957385.1 ubiquitin carboxyl-terminal hydrolase domain-containing protein [Hirsutella rhossiliensis]